MKKYEIRAADISAPEGGDKLSGYAVVWNSPSQVLYDEFIESFAPGAFSASLATGEDIRALFEHNNGQLLGRTSSGTLKLTEDETGLYFELTPPNTQLGRDVLEQVRRRDIVGMSFGFIPTAEDWDINAKPYKRTVKAAELIEITITSIPAYQASNVDLARRSLYAAHPELVTPDHRVFWLETL